MSSWYDHYIIHWTQDPLQKGILKCFSSPHCPPTFPYVESLILIETHKSCLCSVPKINEPTSYEQAC